MEKQDTTREPIALVGRSLRFPGAGSLSELYGLLHRPRDVLGDFPPLRMNIDGCYHPDGDKHGATNVRKSYFITQDHRMFDAAFFNISPVEAEAMDPQQRILLELVYEAMESAGLTINGLEGSRTSVFVGLMSSDFSAIQQQDRDTVPKYAVTGTASSIMSNRISHFYDWKGPSMTIDTACSSSLVAVHLATQSLRSGESDLAVVAGANLILSPEPYITESKLRMLSPTSRCRMWDVRADGYARGDGFAVVILKRLKQAVQDEDHIFSIIRETGVNMDGRTAGLTTPSPSAQAALIRETYERAGLDCCSRTGRCQYFEAHGTGTPTGDPIEAEAVQSAFFPQGGIGIGDDEQNEPLHIGSIKTIVGHLEGCAGLAGLLKASLAVERGMIFPNMHFDTLNPSVEPFYRNMKIPTAARPWPEIDPGAPRRASVNSFGFGGTNAHAIIESYTQKTPGNGSGAQNEEHLEKHDPSSTIVTGGPFVFSCNSRHSLVASIELIISFLKDDAINLQSLAQTLQLRRTVLPVRAAFSGLTKERLLGGLERYVRQAKEAPHEMGAHSHRRSPDTRPKILGIFTGQGAQWPQMGREFVLASPRFGHVLDELQESLNALPDPPSWSLRVELMADPASSRVLEAAVGQPLCTAVQIALVDVLQHAGVAFSVVVGHSSGEIAAAYAAGFLSAFDAIRVAYYRGYHASSTGGPGGRAGAMMAVDMTFGDGLEFCQSSQFSGRLAVAASNSSNSITLSGDLDAIHEARVLLEDRHSVRLLRVDKAYHSHHMQSVVEPYIRSLRACNVQSLPARVDCSWISSVTLDEVTVKAQLGDLYWADNMIQPVLFSQSVERAVRDAGTVELMIEVGPHPTLRVPAEQSANEIGGFPVPYCSLLRRGCHDIESFSSALGYIWTTLGVQAGIDFDGYRNTFACPDQTCQTADFLDDLPSYPWDHQKVHWRESRISRNTRLRNDGINPLLGTRRPDDAADNLRWRNIFHLEELPWLNGHSFQGQAIFPAAGYVSMALEAARALMRGRLGQAIVAEVQDITISRALVLSSDPAGTEVIFSLRRLAEKHKTVTADFVCSSCPCKADAELQVNATGQLHIILADDETLGIPSRTPGSRSMLNIDIDRFYSTLSKVGLDYTGLFHSLKEIRRTTCMSTASANWQASDLDLSLLVHPAVLDTGFQAIFASVGSISAIHAPYLPTRIQRIRINASLIGSRPGKDVDITVNAYTTDIAPPSRNSQPWIRADLDIFCGDDWTLQVEGVSLTPLMDQDSSNDRRLFWQTIWEPDVSSGIFAPEKGKEGSLDETELPELLERLTHVYFRELYAQTPKEKIVTFEWYHQRLFEYMEDTFSRIDKGQHPIIKKEWANDTRQQLQGELARFPDTIDLQAAKVVDESFPAVLAGETTMIEVLMRDDMLTRMYNEGLVLSRGYSLISRMARQICHRYPRVTMLEVGAGTGSTTGPILESIEGAFSSYMYTDVSSGFFGKARELFKAHAAGMEFKALDVEIDPASQGFPTHAYDVVIASSVLHATRCLRATLANVRALLKPGGYLLLLEPTGCSLRVSFMMSGLPGWWLGGDDGRRLFPGLTPTQWDALLKETGFTGVDVLLQDSDEPSKHVYSAILSQAVDGRVAMLRQPLPYLEYIPPVQQLLIVGGTTLQVQRLVKQVCEILLPWQQQIVEADGFDVLDLDGVSDGTTLLCLTELDRPVFESITEEVFVRMRSLLNKARNVLWVTRRQIDNPYANMIVGVARVLLNEATHVNFQVLDISSEHDISPGPQYLTEALLRLVLRETLGPDIVWSTEPELRLEDKTLLIPRLRPNQALNDRLNSNWRSIQAEIPSDSSIAKVHYVNGSYCLWPGPSLDALQIPAGHAAIRTQISLLHPIEVTPGTCVYICLGSLVRTGQRVIACAPSNESVITTRQDWIQEYDPPSCEEGFLHSVAESILARNLLRGIPHSSVLLLNQPQASIAGRVSRLAHDFGVQVVCTTTGLPLPQDNRWIHIGPFVTLRQIKAILPREIARLVDFERGPHDSTLRKLRECVTPSSDLDVTTIFPDHTQVSKSSDDEVPAISIREILESAIRDSGPQTDPGDQQRIMADDLKDAAQKRHRICLVDWRQRNKTYTVDVRPLDPRGLFRSDKTYFLAGLTGDLGQSLSRWMVANGARHIVLASRRGVVPPLWLEEMCSAGVNIASFSVDITDREALSSVYSQVCSTMPSVAGVVNGAMVLSDMLFADMTFKAVTDVLGPKVDGSRNLDALFRSPDLSFFIMLTSLSAVAGFRGQANYAAANMFMTGLAAKRKREGLAGSVVAIGMLTEVGYVSRAGNALEEYLGKKYHCLPISEPEFHQMFAETILAGRPDSHHPSEIITGLQGFKSSDVLDRPPWFVNPRFAHCIVEGTAVEGRTEMVVTTPISQRLADAASVGEATRTLQEDFTGKLATILQIGQSSIDGNVSLIDLGVDSLVAIEIRSWFIKELDVDLPALKTLSGCTAAELCEDVVERLFLARKDNPVLNGRALDEHNDLSVSVDTEAQNSAKIESNGIGPLSPVLKQWEGTRDRLPLGPDEANLIAEGPTRSLTHMESMSFAQSRLWFLVTYADDPTSYNVVLSYDIRGPLNIPRFQNAFQAVISRHQMFRTTFFRHPETSKGMQGILHKSLVTLEQRRVTSDAEVREAIHQAQHHVFEPEQGKLVLATLLQRTQSLSTFVFGYSHIVMDGSSIFLFLQDLNEAYQKQYLEPSAKDYIDFTASQRLLVEGGGLSKEIDFWKCELSPLPEVLPLLDIARSRSRSNRTAYGTHTVHATIPFHHALKIKRLCQKLSVTPFHFYLAAVQWLLFKFLATTEDICIGIADANRLDQRYLRTIGVFLNLLPLRFRRHVQATFVDAMKDTSNKVLSALEHSRLPFEVMLEELDVERSLAYTPLFQVFVNYRMGAFQHNPLGECELQHRSVSEAVFAYDLFITITEPTRESCVVDFTVRDDIYTEDTCSLLLKTFVHLVSQLSENPFQSLDRYGLFSGVEARLGMDVGRASIRTCRLGRTLPCQVESLSQSIPEYVAVKDGYGGSLDYNELARQSLVIAGVLSAAGATRGSFVAVLMHPCCCTIPSLLAILRLAAIYVPLDLDSPHDRLAAITADCRPAAIICQQNTLRLAETLCTGADTMVVDLTFLPEGDHMSTADCSQEDLPAFALYTSGSSGTPKGVLLSQANVLHSVDGTLDGHYANQRETVLQQSSLGFDLSLYQISRAIVSGGALIIVPQVLRRSPEELSKIMLAEGVSLTIATPSEYTLLLSYGNQYLKQCTAWRLAASAGENISLQMCQLFRQLNSPKLVMQNWFGPTEAGVYSVRTLSGQDMRCLSENEYPCIGRPIPNVSVYIVDEELQPVPTGFPGEICIGGPTVALGYMNEGVMDSMFVSGKFSPRAERLYRSGDRGRILPDGTIIFLGRMGSDSQVKLRGFRIDLDDIASTIIRTSDRYLSDAAVSVRGDPGFLVAFVVFAPHRVPDNPTSFQEDLCFKLPLPDYMRPSMMVQVPRIPISPNGKRDRAALEAMPLPRPTGPERETPLSSLETQLKDLWLEALPDAISKSQVSKETRFFQLGGSSILLMKLRALIHEALGVKLSLASLIQFNTLQQMASNIEEGRRQQERDRYPEDTEEEEIRQTLQDKRLLPFPSAAGIDWEAETDIPEDILAQTDRDPQQSPKPRSKKTVLLTGSTEILGRSMLQQLVGDSEVAEVHCVAVPMVGELDHYTKVVSYVGNLSMPNLGLDQTEMEMLSREVDLILHASVEGSFLSTYRTMRDTSLGAVRHLTRIACRRRIPIHFLSSSRVVLFSGAASLSEVSVERFFPPPDGSEGLAAARWACERYLQNIARELGLPVYIHRCCAATSDRAPEGDVLNSIWRYSRRMKAAPILDKVDGFIDVVPLEALVDRIFHVVMETRSLPHSDDFVTIIHHTSGNRITAKDLGTYFEEEEGGPVENLDLNEWLRRAQEIGLPEFAAAFLDAVQRRDEPVFFPLLISTRHQSVLSSH